MVLAIYAHPDDPAVSCGGSLSRWASEGATVHVCIGCRGDKGAAASGVTSDELVALRADEVARAGALMGVSEHHFLGYPDGELAPLPELTGQIVKLLRRLRPAVVVAPDPTAVFFGSNYINHRDHRELGWAVLDAVSPGAASVRYFADAGEPYQVPLLCLSGTLEPDLWVDIGGFLNEKALALAAHSTQVGDDIEWLRQVVREEASQAAPPGGPPFVESFRRMVLA